MIFRNGLLVSTIVQSLSHVLHPARGKKLILYDDIKHVNIVRIYHEPQRFGCTTIPLERY